MRTTGTPRDGLVIVHPMRYAILASLLWLGGCFADGKDVIMPEDPDYAALCGDSTVATPDHICWGKQRIDLTIDNPLYRDTTSSQ